MVLMASARRMGFLSSRASSVSVGYFAEGVDGQDDDVWVRLRVVDHVQVVELLELEVRVLHVLNDLVLRRLPR